MFLVNVQTLETPGRLIQELGPAAAEQQRQLQQSHIADLSVCLPPPPSIGPHTLLLDQPALDPPAAARYASLYSF